MSSPGGGGSPINSVIEAEQRARKLGAPAHPDAAEDQAERNAQRATWVIVALAVVGGAWLVAGPGAAAVTFGAIAVAVLAVWRMAAWLRGRRGGGSEPPS